MRTHIAGRTRCGRSDCSIIVRRPFENRSTTERRSFELRRSVILVVATGSTESALAVLFQSFRATERDNSSWRRTFRARPRTFPCLRVPQRRLSDFLLRIVAIITLVPPKQNIPPQAAHIGSQDVFSSFLPLSPLLFARFVATYPHAGRRRILHQLREHELQKHFGYPLLSCYRSVFNGTSLCEAFVLSASLILGTIDAKHTKAQPKATNNVSSAQANVFDTPSTLISLPIQDRLRIYQPRLLFLMKNVSLMLRMSIAIQMNRQQRVP